jgi:hypothetical protein
MSQMWLTPGPTTPVLIPGTDESLLYATAHGLGWAVLRRPIGRVDSRGHDLLVDEEQLSSLFGGFLHSMGYRLEQSGVVLPSRLHAAISDAPAGAIGHGDGTLISIDGAQHYGTRWQFDSYCAAVTTFETTWLALLTPQAKKIVLRPIDTHRSVSW